MTTRRPHLALGALALVAAATLVGCSSTAESAPSASADTTVAITATNGTVTVPVNPEKVVALDNTTFATLRDWGVTPVALPKDLLPAEGFEDWAADESILNIGTHREPDLEALSAIDADIILGGYRFASYTDQLTDMKIAPVVDIAANADAEGGYVESLRASTTNLGKIFDRADDATALNAKLDTAIADAKSATNDESVFLAIVNGGKIDNGAERIGRLLEPLNLTDVFAGEAGDIHKDSGLSIETIAQANPDWMIVLDRDAGTSTEGASPAKAIIDAQEGFAGTTFTKNEQVIYLDPFFYTTEGIQAYTDAFDSVATAFSA